LAANASFTMTGISIEAALAAFKNERLSMICYPATVKW